MDEIFRSIFTAIFSSFVAISFLVIQLSPSGSVAFFWAWIIFAVLNPLYVLLPMLIFRSRIRAWKKSEQARILEKIAKAVQAGDEPLARELTRWKSHVAGAGEWPFRGLRYLIAPALYAFTVIPGMIAMWSVIAP